MQLSRVSRDEWEAKPITHDDHLLVGHQGIAKSFDFIVTEHVDDIKAACAPETAKLFIRAVKKTFGEDELEIT